MLASPYLMLILVLYVTFSLIGTVLFYKVITLGPGLAPGGLLVLPLVLMIEDVVAEVYGYRISRLLLWYVLLSIFLFAFISWLIIKIPSPTYWHGAEAFKTVFNPIIKSSLSLILALFVIRFLNIYLIAKTKIFVRGRYFWIRSIFSTLIGSLVGLFLLFGIAFFHGMPLSDIFNLSLTDYAVRALYAVFGGGPAWLLVIFLKKKEQVDVYDNLTNFNPFKIGLSDNKN